MCDFNRFSTNIQTKLLNSPQIKEKVCHFPGQYPDIVWWRGCTVKKEIQYLPVYYHETITYTQHI